MPLKVQHLLPSIGVELYQLGVHTRAKNHSDWLKWLSTKPKSKNGVLTIIRQWLSEQFVRKLTEGNVWLKETRNFSKRRRNDSASFDSAASLLGVCQIWNCLFLVIFCVVYTRLTSDSLSALFIEILLMSTYLYLDVCMCTFGTVKNDRGTFQTMSGWYGKIF